MTARKMHPAERRREVELRELAALMRERGGLAALPPPRPLHKMGRPDESGQNAGNPTREDTTR